MMEKRKLIVPLASKFDIPGKPEDGDNGQGEQPGNDAFSARAMALAAALGGLILAAGLVALKYKRVLRFIFAKRRKRSRTQSTSSGPCELTRKPSVAARPQVLSSGAQQALSIELLRKRISQPVTKSEL